MESATTQIIHTIFGFTHQQSFNTSRQEIIRNSFKGSKVGQTTNAALPGIASDEITQIIKYVTDLWLCSILSYLGIFNNIIAIFVFKKMGFQDTMNISLTAIAFWDVAKCLCSATLRLYGPIQLSSPAFAHTWYSYANIYIGYFYSTSGYVSGVLAAYVAIERCLCVSRPFTVKTILTTKVAKWVNVLVSIVVLATLLVVYVRFDFVWVFSPRYNATVANFIYSSIDKRYPVIEQYTSAIAVVYPVVSFTAICICTVIILCHLRKASIIRQTTTNSLGNKNPKELSSRDKQVTKMLLVIIFVYIVGYVPRLCFFMAMMTVPEFQPRMRYGNMMWISVYIMHAFDIVNGAINPFIFFFMSSQFRSTLTNMFSLSRRDSVKGKLLH